MRAAIFLWVIGLPLIFAAIRYDPDASNRLFIEAQPASAPAAPKVAVLTIEPDAIARAKFPKSNPRTVDIIAAVNRVVNAAILGVTDAEQYGQDERFVAWPATGKGDCEDYALSKIEALGNLGMPLPGNAILLSVVVKHADGSLTGHAIAQIRLPDGTFMYLDNMFDAPMTRAELVAEGYIFFDWSDA